MPRLSVYFIRASLVHMGLGFLFGSLILHHKGIPIYGWTWRLLPVHIEMMVYGWTIQFVMGAAFWILPRFSGENRYGNVALGWASLALINSGILLTAAGSWYSFSSILLPGRLVVLAAIVLFVLLIWARVKPLGGRTAARNRGDT